MSDNPLPESADDQDAGIDPLGPSSNHPTGEEQAAENRANEPPA
jgi:hypothetical protein